MIFPKIDIILGFKLKKRNKSFEATPETVSNLRDWIPMFLEESRVVEVWTTEEDDFHFFGREEYKWPFISWRNFNFQEVLLEKINKLERSLCNRVHQYESLQDEFRELFEEDENSDEEGGDE